MGEERDLERRAGGKAEKILYVMLYGVQAESEEKAR